MGDEPSFLKAVAQVDTSGTTGCFAKPRSMLVFLPASTFFQHVPVLNQAVFQIAGKVWFWLNAAIRLLCKVIIQRKVRSKAALHSLHESI